MEWTLIVTVFCTSLIVAVILFLVIRLLWTHRLVCLKNGKNIISEKQSSGSCKERKVVVDAKQLKWTTVSSGGTALILSKENRVAPVINNYSKTITR